MGNSPLTLVVLIAVALVALVVAGFLERSDRGYEWFEDWL